MLKRNLFFLFSITLFAVASTLLDVFNYNPYKANSSIFINFYVSVLFSLIGLFSMIIFYFKIRIHKYIALNTYFWPSVRQSFFIASSIVALLLLKSMDLLDWWVGIPLIIAIVLLELFFQTNNKSLKRKI